jgi:hypothetical protein
MKVVFWNSRGFADLAKHRFLAELVREEQINFIALSETGVESFPDHVLKLAEMSGTGGDAGRKKRKKRGE